MKVFISHKQEDQIPAINAYRILIENGHTAYLDVVDSMIQKNGDDLGDYLREQLEDCDALLAVVTRNTIFSWWVPWEIGVATEKEYPLSTYLADNTNPPEFMNKWPVLRTQRDLTLFAGQLNSLEVEIRRGYATKSLNEARHFAVPDFHKSLKRAIGQTP